MGSPHDEVLRGHTHPSDWGPPTPADRYDLVAVGGGTAGLVASIGAAGLGAKVALVERSLLGGDCLVHGCVPSKAVLHPAHVVATMRRASALGIGSGAVEVDFAAVMERMRSIRAHIAEHDGAERLKREGVDVFFGDAAFVGPDRLRVGDLELRFRRACIATGARAARPPIPGLDDAGVLTNETLFDLTECPERLVVVGAGAIGCEMAQAMARLGSEVVLVDVADRVLGGDAADAAAVVQETLVGDGVQLRLGVGVERFERDGDERRTVLASGEVVASDQVLLAVGRTPNLDLGLDTAGVEHGPDGVFVDDFLRTTNGSIYAAGDVIGGPMFTHAAYHEARLVVGNALFGQWGRRSQLVVPHATYTEPELAAVGTTGDVARAAGLTPYTAQVADNDRARTEGEDAGFLRVWVDDGGAIRGATWVGRQAGELLVPVVVAMTHGIPLHALASTVFAYPTRSELLFAVAGQANKARLKPWMKKGLGFVLEVLR